jgi:ketosteroid isomerase-like protein
MDCDGFIGLQATVQTQGSYDSSVVGKIFVGRKSMNTWFSSRFLSLVAALVLLSACDGLPGGAPPEPVIDLEQERENLLQQDLRFAEAAYTEGVAEAYRRFMAEDAIQLPDGGLAIGGREEIYADMLALTDGADFSLSWEPLEVEVAASGELGYTWGIYSYEALDELGAPFVAEGKYVYLWRKNAGRWELILDITNQTEPVYEELLEDELIAPAAEAEPAAMAPEGPAY